MATSETSHDETVPLAEEPNNRPEWLIDIMKEQQELLTVKTEEQVDEKPTRPMTRIQKVNKILRESNEERFDPLVVSLGPFHHGKAHLMRMEPHKNVAAAWFISLATGKTGKRANTITETDTIYVYQKFKNAVAFSPRDRYADHESFHEPKFQSESEDLMPMMFLDGCFILHFIHLVVNVNGWSDDLSNSSHPLNQKHIVRDMFLLENQIPYPILSALMSLLTDQKDPRIWIMEFIFTFFLPPLEFNFSAIGFWRVLVFIFELLFLPIRGYIFLGRWKSIYGVGVEPLHLLDLLRAVFVGDGSSPLSSCGRRCRDYDLRPIRELKAAGIRVSKGSSWLLKEVKFKKGLINSNLELPQIIVDDYTETRLLNLVAYEMCPDGPLEHTATSYICFLNSLIHKREDVKELQSENILLNHLNRDEDVVDLFRTLAYYSCLSPEGPKKHGPDADRTRPGRWIAATCCNPKARTRSVAFFGPASLSPDHNADNDVVNGIKDHYKRHFNRERVRIGEWVDQCKRTYFTSPWTIISLIAAIFLLLLTLLQTIYTIWGFYKAN